MKVPSSYMKEATTPSQQELPEQPRLFRNPIATEKPSNYGRIFWAYLIAWLHQPQGHLNKAFVKILSATSTLQPPTVANEDDLHLQQKQVFDATQSITSGLEEQPSRPNPNLVSPPLTTTLWGPQITHPEYPICIQFTIPWSVCRESTYPSW
jgi:hypothetical protein